ncbi:MAG: DUF6465 family protein [Pseudoflavonifractor capillosus]|uniref:DUF6465 family protein n=1 Tax=Pseudoflavonifractor capillosus TaxID=106588 RepID=UPI0023F83EAD|nr:DUF6465 family protein [Pseudoflavonifractor capillosus]MCI5928792.1 DUF6465 family protein [Pseudoflavonifractor capillosus]MDY4660276.1 DUF6465 family protein [Pseudoflavonifractor capillosus]
MIAGAKRREAAVKAAEEKTAAKAVETVETKAVKAEVETVAKAEPVKAEPVAETAPKAAEKKTARKTATKKAPAKKAAEKAVEAPAEKAAETKTTIILEYCGRQVTETTMIAGAKKVWAEAGRTEAIETMELYVKPEDGAVYCVINGEPIGKFCY